MPACRGMRLRPPPGGAPLAPVVAPGESRRRGLLVKNEHRPVFVQGRRSCHSPFGLTRFPTGPMSSGPELAKCSRQIECTGDVERRLLHRFRVGLAPRDLDEQETFRKRCVAGAQSAVTERCLSASPHPRMLQARRRVARSGMAHTGISEWHWLWQEVRPFVRYQAASLLCILSASFVSLVDPLRMKWLASGGQCTGHCTYVFAAERLAYGLRVRLLDHFQARSCGFYADASCRNVRVRAPSLSHDSPSGVGRCSGSDGTPTPCAE